MQENPREDFHRCCTLSRCRDRGANTRQALAREQEAEIEDVQDLDAGNFMKIAQQSIVRTRSSRRCDVVERVSGTWYLEVGVRVSRARTQVG